ncbi:MAG: hypothetical protein FJ090_05845 [Deltaproteobacteria bacterium]|nr:hypothetical protein [Deltaproteobacteria bacterium]
MTLHVLMFAVGPGCDSGAEKEPGDTSGDGDTGNTDTGNTDTGNTDSGNTDSGPPDSGPPDSGDTGTPPPSGAYYGPPAGFALVGDRASGNSDEVAVWVINVSDGSTTTVADLAVRADSVGSCGASFVWLLESNNSAAESDYAYGIDAATGALTTTLELGALFGPQALIAKGNALVVGGLSGVATYGEDGVLASTVDLTAYADSDGSPEVMALADAPEGIVAVLGRVSSSGYDQSGVVLIDTIDGTVKGNGLLSGVNAGRNVAYGPDGVTVVLEPTKTGSTTNEDGGVEGFSVSTWASTGTLLDFTGVQRVATTISSSDGTVSTAIKDDAGAINIIRYDRAGSAISTVPANTITNGLAVLASSFLSAEGNGSASKVIAYGPDGATQSTATIGADVRGLWACSPPPSMPDDTGRPDSGAPE